MNISSTSATARFTVIRGYYEATEQHDVTITTPGGAVVGPIALGGTSGVYPGPLTVNGNVYIENGLSLTATGDKLVYIAERRERGDHLRHLDLHLHAGRDRGGGR